ncbi:enoyl-CoA hydratase/isomerase family protein [Devosia sp.]|uniref:enoyl-CoA hydratase/isomerase family protein n=1 Tax=Devosia sp. TaxID=1871048 RepID=UPI002EEAC311
MSAQLEIFVEGHMGVIALNRPEAINALSHGMIAGIAATLALWRDDDNVRAVLFEARGSRGFCAGGDVRAARELVIAGRRAEAEAYFADEYAMNLMIATYGKPVLVIADGIVMGGGIGIAGHARFRFTTPAARFAMPEAGIGFFGDVGVNAILAKAPEHRALLFLLSGAPVGAADALALGLTDCAVLPESLPQLRAGLVAAAGTGDIEPAVVALMQALSIQAGDLSLCALADRLAPALQLETAQQIVAAVARAGAGDPEIAELAALLRARSPTSLAAILHSHRAARSLPGIAEVLALDLRMARLLAVFPDFAEGVRAVLVDKDRRPRWTAEPPLAAIQAAVAGAGAAAAQPV